MNKKQLILGIVLLCVLFALGVYAQHRYPFNWHALRVQFIQARWRNFALGTACIYAAYVFRTFRWTYLLRHNKRVPPFSLLGTQVMGFTAVALIGRVADPVRPYLVAKKTGLPLSNQLAVYIVERLFDAGTMALIFSVALISLTQEAIPHAEAVRQGHWGPFTTFMSIHPVIALNITRFGVLFATFLGGLFLLAIRMAGEVVASFFERVLGALSTKLGRAVGDKIRAFHAGLDTMRSFADFGVTVGLSLAMWILITVAYLETIRGFVANEQLASMNPARCVVLMMASGGASIFQLPVLGWFTQTLAVAAVFSAGFGVNKEAATGCAAMLLLVTFISVIPVGLIWAQFEHVSLRKVTHESEVAEETLEADESLKAAE